MKITIRPAIESDTEKIMALVNELAIFEKAADEVINTADQLKIDGFGNHPLFKSIVADADHGILGFALYYYRYSTWKGKVLYLEDFYVKEAFRNFGIGKQLFDEIIKTAKNDKCQRISWQVLDWNEPAIKFYEKYNSQFDKEWWNGYLEM
ncbi:MAG: N-acetyltransferase family protein [Bacteroidia bacterium]